MRSLATRSNALVPVTRRRPPAAPRQLDLVLDDARLRGLSATERRSVLVVAYRGRRRTYPTYRCDRPNLQLGHRRCIVFGGGRVDEAIAVEMLRAVVPLAIEAAKETERMLKREGEDRLRIAGLELTQAKYDASLAERRYAACDPDNRLIAAQLEKAWQGALQRVEQCRKRLDDLQAPDAGCSARPSHEQTTRSWNFLSPRLPDNANPTSSTSAGRSARCSAAGSAWVNGS
jgi:hypothetical protein